MYILNEPSLLRHQRANLQQRNMVTDLNYSSAKAMTTEQTIDGNKTVDWRVNCGPAAGCDRDPG